MNTAENSLYEDTIPGGAHWSLELRRGTTLTLIDIEGSANVGMLFYNPRNYLERYNAPDTLKCQHTFKITKGHCLYSDMGRIFCSVIDDDCGWHDTVCGNLTDTNLEKKWQNHSYQEKHNDWTISGEHSFLVELAKYGMNQRDLAANLNLFSCVVTDNNGNLKYADQQSKPGSRITLRFEMDTLVLFHTCPHPMSTAKAYPKKPVTYQIAKAPPIAENDVCKNHCAENQRGFENNRIYHLCTERGGE